MTKKELEKKLAAHRDELQKMGVVSPAVFGSVARNEPAQQSDIDLLVEFDRDVGLFQLFKIQHRTFIGTSIGLLVCVMKNHDPLITHRAKPS